MESTWYQKRLLEELHIDYLTNLILANDHFLPIHQGGIVGVVCGFALQATLGVGNFLSAPWPTTLNSTVVNCPASLNVSDHALYGK